MSTSVSNEDVSVVPHDGDAELSEVGVFERICLVGRVVLLVLVYHLVDK